MRKRAILKALFPSVRQRVLSATLTRPEKWWYLSELAGFLNTSPSSLQREVSSIVDAGILEQRRDGTRLYFRAERRSPIFRELRGIFEKTAGMFPILQEVMEPFGNRIVCSFVYGSVARAQEHALSDVDLMVIGSVGLADLAPALRMVEKRLGREVNLTSFSVREFRDKVVSGDHFLTSVLKKPKHFVLGSQSELEAVTR